MARLIQFHSFGGQVLYLDPASVILVGDAHKRVSAAAVEEMVRTVNLTSGVAVDVLDTAANMTILLGV